ncbi:cytoplasmic dynein 2 intermediate chain 1 isoform X2 [Kryptolebias marmoratus]|uniref:Dynein 2 intermediate chain 1 n=1 Tax=Kryptolebias marmoratus TaxID=37003 RepID=A0A3Q3AN22_KRYMA|nr:cytoplasmic dynein 2 intermediate chain 1 isoform X2 [Kryptolebias marmoratus]
MHSEKKITKEDTWRTADLRRHIRENVYDGGHMRKKDDNERKHRGGESTERRHRDPEESRQDRDKLRERESTRERKDGDNRDRYAAHSSKDRGKESSQDRRGDKHRDRRDDRDRERRRQADDRENRDKRPDREETRDRERHRDKHKEKERIRDREKHTDEDRDKRREERDRNHRSERRRHEERGKERRDETENQHKEHRDRRHRDDYEDKRKEKDSQQRHGDRNHSEQKEEREYKEEHRRHREERERRHKDRGHHDEKQRHESDPRKHQELKLPDENVRYSHGERAVRDKNKERWKKEEEDVDRRYKERKHREEEGLEKIHQERTSSKKLSSDESPRHEKKEEKTEGNNDEDLAEQEYEDDFEDYEDDFDEVDASADEGENEKDSVVEDDKEKLTAQQSKEIESIQRAMAEENERAVTTQSRQSMSRKEEDGLKQPKDSEKNQIKVSKHGKFMNFVAAKQREVSKKVATKQKKRSTELLRLIDLDFSMTFPLLDLPPVSEYEMYIRNFGNANTKQAYVQCNEDNVDQDIQSEEIEVCEKWTQHPPEHIGACGDPNLSQEARDKTRSELNFDSQHLTSFLHSASQVILVLLEEDQAERKSLRNLKNQKESLSFSDGSLQLNTKLPFLLGRQISLVHFSQVQKHTMLSVHLPTAKASAVRLDSSTIICIWNIWEPSRPQKILLYESEVQCCCFSPGKSTLVFAGTSVGSVVLWDLREQTSNHYSLKIGEEEWTFRQPTFSTDAVMAGSGHFSSVTSVEVVSSTVARGLSSEVPFLASEEESSGLSFQLASLDESGVLNFWVVLELPKGNEAGSPTDLGLRPGGKVKLLHSSSLLTADRTRDASKTGQMQTLLLKFLPTDSNHFFIGTNLGLVSHGTSHGLKAPPKSYRFQEVEERPVDISSISFSPFRPHLFLVGCGDGSIRLHAVSQDQPVAEWRSATAGEPVVSLQWAQTRPAVFCVLDAASNLYIWDLLESDAQPVVTERMSADRVTAVSVFGDSGQQNTYSGVALAHESGRLELHYFTRSFTAASSAEEEKLESLLTEAV